jgi:hypothetical protein
MTSNSIIYLTINLADSSLDPEELDEETHNYEGIKRIGCGRAS